MKLNSTSNGVVLGLFTGSIHLLWVLLVVLGLAQPLLDFIYSMHFLSNPFTVQAFSFWYALVLIVLSTVVGYLVGWVLSVLWNNFHKNSPVT